MNIKRQQFISRMNKDGLISLCDKTASEAREMRQVLVSMCKYIERNDRLQINKGDEVYLKMKQVSKIQLTLEETYALEKIVMGEDRGFLNSPAIGRLLGEGLVDLDMFGERLIVSKSGLDYISSMVVTIDSQQPPKQEKIKQIQNNNQSDGAEDILSSGFKCPH